jgi:hypothetical protein
VQEFYDSEFPLVRLNGMLHRGVDVLAQWRQCASGTAVAGSNEIELLLSRIVELDAELANWELTTPAWLNYGVYSFEQQHTGQPHWIRQLLGHPGSPPIMHYYTSLVNVYGWNLYRMLRIFLNKTIINSISTFPQHTHSIALDLKTSLLIVKKLADDICACVLSILTVPIPGKLDAASEQDICGIRVQGLTPALQLARTCLRGLSGHPESEMRADWLNCVMSFVSRELRRGRG